MLPPADPRPTVHLLLPGDPATLTGGYLYDARIVRGLRRRGWHVPLIGLSDRFPFPTDVDLAEAESRLAALPDGALVLADGLAFGALPASAERHGGRLRLVALVHHLLGDESGLAPKTRDALLESERRALARARRVVVTSPQTARAVSALGVADATVISPGTDRATPAGGGGAEPVLLCVGSVTPRKGHDVLVAALARIAGRRWQAVWVGSETRDPAWAREVRGHIAAAGLSGRVEHRGELSGPDLDSAYRGADIFVLASRHEGYGMVLTEALARGLPVVATAAGAAPDTVPSEAGLLVPADDAPAFAAALARLLDAPAERRRLAAGARAARHRLPTWRAAGAAMAAVLEEVRQT